MKLYKLVQDKNDHYDAFHSAVVSAVSEDSARMLHPSGYHFWEEGQWFVRRSDGTSYPAVFSSWVEPSEVVVEYLGEADPGIVVEGIILAS